MTISFKEFSEGRRPTLKFSPGLVLGWTTVENASQVRYALFADGVVFKTDPISIYSPENNSFAPKGCKWTKTESVPEHAEFIGHYHAPVRRGA